MRVCVLCVLVFIDWGGEGGGVWTIIYSKIIPPPNPPSIVDEQERNRET